MKGIVNYLAVRAIILNSMSTLDFGKAFGLAKKFFKDDSVSISICCGNARIIEDGTVEDSIDKEISDLYASILNKYSGVFVDERGCFYKVELIESSSFLTDESLSVMAGWGNSIIVASSIDSEKRRIIDDKTNKLYSHDAFYFFENKIVFLSRFENPIDKRFTPFFVNIDSAINHYLGSS